jgi:hypothetical protein
VTLLFVGVVVLVVILAGIATGIYADRNFRRELDTTYVLGFEAGVSACEVAHSAIEGSGAKQAEICLRRGEAYTQRTVGLLPPPFTPGMRISNRMRPNGETFPEVLIDQSNWRKT